MSFNLPENLEFTVTPRLVAENNDLRSINWVAGVTDPGEMIACGYLPQLRRLANEQDAAYLARITPLMQALPQKTQDRIMGAALKRASLSVAADGQVQVVVAGEAARRGWWHQLGKAFEDTLTVSQAFTQAKMDYRVDKIAGEWSDAAGNRHTSKKQFVLVRQDTGAELNWVGPKYKVCQNIDAFSFVDDVLRGYGGARISSCGVLYDGAKVWIQAEFPQFAYKARGAEHKATALLTNSHGDEPIWVFATDQRVCCANTRRLALHDRFKGLRIQHTGDMKSKIKEAQAALGLAMPQFAKSADEASVLARTPLSVQPYAAAVLDAVLGVTDVEAALRQQRLAPLAVSDAIAKLEHDLELRTAKKTKMLEAVLAAYDSDRATGRGTAYDAYQALSDAADHTFAVGRKTENFRSRQMESILTGDADDLKVVAYEAALASAR